ncbi:MAG: integration host factor subunit beta [Myxococcales bacterium]|nr:integration host factor subunit beta [Myxococcales bacterium]
MTKSQLIEAVAARAGISRDRAAVVVNTLFSHMTDALSLERRIEIRNFGNFVVKHYDGYNGRNPRTGAMVEVPQKRLPFFKAGLEIRKRLNGEI